MSVPRLDLARPAVVFVLLSLATALLVRGCWDAPFINIDDDKHVVPALTGDSWTDVFRFKLGSPYFYLTMLSYRLDHALSGTAPGATPDEQGVTGGQTASLCGLHAPPVRAASAFYHLLGSLVLWVFLRRMKAGSALAAVVALFWAGHPMACESVCWISERKNVLAALFGFGALLAWTAPPQRLWRRPLVWLLFVLALLSKATALGLLPVFAALEIIFPPEGVFDWRRGRQWLVLAGRLAVPVAISAAAVVVSVQGHKLEMVDPPGGSAWTALLTDTEIVARYVFNILMPANLSFFYAVRPIVSLLDPRLWLYGAALLLFFAGLIATARREDRPLALLGVIWFFGALGTHSNLLAMRFWMQDRYAYLALPGLALAVGLAVRGLAERRPELKRWLTIATAAYLAAVMLQTTAVRSPLFADSDDLELDALARQPDSGMARSCAARIFKERHLQHLPEGSQPDPERAQFYAQAALEQYERIVECPDGYNYMDPFTARVCRAAMLVSAGRTPEARELLKGWLPPPNMTLLPAVNARGQTLVYSPRAMLAGYLPETLGRAWMVLAEGDLREAAKAGLPADAQQALCRQALEQADKALALTPGQYGLHVLKARAYLRWAELKAAGNEPEAAQQHRAAAVEWLKKVPPSSDFGGYAQSLLAGLRRLKTP